MKVVVALAVTAAVFAGVGAAVAVGFGPGAEPSGVTRLAVPEPGEVSAVLLDDGAPAFVVAHGDGSITVLSAINPHLDRLAVWCADDRSFWEPGPASRWDERGRYMGGPAPRGLTPYAVEVEAGDGAAVVVVGDRLEAPGRDVPSLVPAGPPCEWLVEERPEGVAEVLAGAYGHDLPALLGELARPEDAVAQDTRSARYGRYAARLDVGAQAITVCSPRPEPGCPTGSVALASTFHRWSWATFWADQRCRGHVDAELLARRTPAGFADAAIYPRFTAVGVSHPGGFVDDLTCDPPEQFAGVALVQGTLVQVEDQDGSWVAVLEEPGEPQPTGHLQDPSEVPDLGARTRWSFGPHALVQTDVLLHRRGRPGAAEQLPQTFFGPHDLPALLDAVGPLPVELWLDGDGVIGHGRDGVRA